jgi:integrase
MAFKPFLFHRRGRVWTIVYPGADGRKRQKATKYRGAEEEGKAKKALAAFVRKWEAGQLLATGADDGGPMTVAKWATRWLESRKAKGISTVGDYESRLKHHILPHVGWKRLDAVTSEDVVAVMAASAGLAPRTRRHVYYTMNAMFRKAIPRFIETNPCAIDEEDLPRKKDADPEWRPTAIFSREEVLALLTSPLVPIDRQTFYAVAFLAGPRFGEIAALHLRHYVPDLQPLAQLQVSRSYNSKRRKLKGVKTDRPRVVPVHPWLKQILDAWLGGPWAEMMGREPGAGDILIPTRRGNPRNASTMWKQLNGERANPAKGKPAVVGDLERLGLRSRRQHDARRTFITLAREDGARKDLLRLVTHGPEGDIIDIYSEMPWASLCEEVAKLKLGPPVPAIYELGEGQGGAGGAPAVVKLPASASDGGGLPPGCHGEETTVMTGQSVATPAGFENHRIGAQASPLTATGPDPRGKLTDVDALTASGPAADRPEGPMATVATLALRQALDALDRGRLDQVRSILERALAEERGQGGAVAGRRR